MSYLDFIKKDEKDKHGRDIYKIWNKTYKQFVGEIRKERFGTWMHWQLFYLDLKTGFTNGCLKEISLFITSLYRKDKRERDERIKHRD